MLVPVLTSTASGLESFTVTATGTLSDAGQNPGPDGFTFTFNTTPLQEGGHGTPGTADQFDALIGAFVPQSVVDTAGFQANDATKPGVTGTADSDAAISQARVPPPL